MGFALPFISEMQVTVKVSLVQSPQDVGGVWNYLSSFRMTKAGPPANWFPSSSEAKSAGKDLNPIFMHVFVGPLSMIGAQAELLCVPVYIWGIEGR